MDFLQFFITYSKIVDAVDSRRREIRDEIVQQTERTQGIPDAVERIRADILDQISLEV